MKGFFDFEAAWLDRRWIVFCPARSLRTACLLIGKTLAAQADVQ